MKPIVFYHAPCTDGFGAAFAAWLYLGDNAEYRPQKHKVHYNVRDFEWVKNRDVYILDFAFPREVTEYIFEHAGIVVWLDHHLSSFQQYFAIFGGEPNYECFKKCSICVDIVFDNNKSGALIAWEYFKLGKVPELISFIDDRDRWVLALNGSQPFHAALGSRKPWTFEKWKVLLDSFKERKNLRAFLREGQYILNARESTVREALKHSRRCAISTAEHPNDTIAVGYAVNASDFQSEIGNELAMQSGTFGLVWYVQDTGKVKCSLRSSGSYDVCSIAACFPNGGGHRNAAGFETTLEVLGKWIHAPH